MNLEAQEKTWTQDKARQLLNVMFAQGEALPDNRAYLDGCSMVITFKTKKYLKGSKTLPNGIKINCNAGVGTTTQMESYGRHKVWYFHGGIANIFSMQKFE